METLEEKIQRVTNEKVAIELYNPKWPLMFKNEKRHLLSDLPNGLINRIEHFGSTAVPDLPAKPIIDMLVEVTSLEKTKTRIVPILESQGYDYFWRPTWGDDIPPFYAWFIKRNINGIRTHHIHMVEDSLLFVEHWDRLLFKDYLVEHPETAIEYKEIKLLISDRFKNDRIKYTNSKTKFIQRVTLLAKEYFRRA